MHPFAHSARTALYHAVTGYAKSVPRDRPSGACKVGCHCYLWCQLGRRPMAVHASTRVAIAESLVEHLQAHVVPIGVAVFERVEGFGSQKQRHR